MWPRNDTHLIGAAFNVDEALKNPLADLVKAAQLCCSAILQHTGI